MEEVRRRTSLAPLASTCFILSLLSLETEGLLAFQGSAGITSIVRWNLHPVIFGVETKRYTVPYIQGSALQSGLLPQKSDVSNTFAYTNSWVRKAADRKFPEFLKFSSRILPRILLRIFPVFFEDFSCFVSWKEPQKKFTKNPRHFSMQNSQANTTKNIHKMFLESRQSNKFIQRTQTHIIGDLCLPPY